MPLDFPSNPTNGQVYDSYVYNATVGAWQAREDSRTVAILSSTVPASANPGDIWVNTNDGISFVYYNDGTSAQWMELLPSGVPLLNTKANLSGGNSFTGIQTFGTPIGLSSGGTNASLTAVNGGVVWSSASALGIISAGTSGQVLKSNGAAAPTWQTLDLSYLPDAAFKKSVKAATTANITLSGTQTVDGIALVAGDRVLVKNQTTASQNGIYDVSASAWTRPADTNLSSEMAGAVVNIDSGTQGGQLWSTSFKTTDTLDTTAMNWYRIVDTSYTIPVSNGGTGTTTLTSGGYLKGAGTAAITSQTGIPAGDITSGSLAEARLPSGTVIQSVTYSYNTYVSGTGTTNTDIHSGTRPAITAKRSDSRFLILASMNWLQEGSRRQVLRCLRNGTLVTPDYMFPTSIGSGWTAANMFFQWLDSSARTAGTTYTFSFQTAVTAGTWYYNYDFGGITGTSTYTILEIVA